jgi:hypothetical protein
LISGRIIFRGLAEHLFGPRHEIQSGEPYLISTFQGKGDFEEVQRLGPELGLEARIQAHLGDIEVEGFGHHLGDRLLDTVLRGRELYSFRHARLIPPILRRRVSLRR